MRIFPAVTVHLFFGLRHVCYDRTMQEIHSILFGLENTLLNQFGDIPPATMSVLEDLHQKGCLLGLSTMRSAHWLMHFLERKRIAHLFSFLIASNGSEYINLRTHRRKRFEFWSVEEGGKLLDELSHPESEMTHSLGNLPIARGADNNGRYVFEKPGYYTILFFLRDHTGLIDFHGIRSLPENTQLNRLIVLGSKPILNRIAHFPALENLSVVRATPTRLEIYPPESSIMHAFDLAKEEFGLHDESTLTFGSRPLEKELLQRTWGIAMKNSPKEVIDCAKRVTKYNAAQNGIAYMINVLLMEKTCVFRKPK